MKKLGYILFGMLLIVAVSACEKEEITPYFSDDTVAADDTKSHDGSCNNGYRGNEGDGGHSNNTGTDGSGGDPEGDRGDGVKDPDEDEDFDADDNIVDPDEDEDFDEEEDGK